MMTYRKTKFSYILWFLYAVVCAALLTVGGSMWARTVIDMEELLPAVIGVAAVLAAYLLYRIMEKIGVWFMRNRTWSRGTSIAAECAAVLLIMTGAVLLRVACLNDVAAQIGGAGETAVFSAAGQEYYARAAVMQGVSSAPLDHGISDLYVRLLSVALSFLGNKAVSVVFVQLVLQMLCLVIAYAATRKLAGRLPACVACLYLAGSFACLHMLVYPGPEWLFFAFYLTGLYLTGSFVKGYCAGRIPRAAVPFGALAVGAVIGLLGYLDMTAASLMLVVLSIAAVRKGKDDRIVSRVSGGMSAAVILTAVISCVVVWLAAIGVSCHAAGAGSDIYGAMEQSIRGRMAACYENSYLWTMWEPYAADRYLMGILVFLAMFLVYAFIRNGKTQNYVPWIFLGLLAAPTPLAVYGEHGFGVLSLYIWAVLAGLGLQNCLFGTKAKVMKSMIAQINAAAEQAEKTAPVVEEIVPAAEKTEPAVEEVMPAAEPQPAYIENPLPLPRKHVRRDMDYQYEVAEQDMKYDIEVAEDDDFDIQ